MIAVRSPPAISRDDQRHVVPGDLLDVETTSKLVAEMATASRPSIRYPAAADDAWTA